MIVLHRDALVLVRTLEVVRTVRRDVQQGRDANAIQDIFFGCMEGAAEEQEGEDLHRATLSNKQKIYILKLIILLLLLNIICANTWLNILLANG